MLPLDDHPYRSAPPRDDEPAAPPREEAVAYGLLVGVGAIPVSGALGGGVFGPAATFGALMIGAGAAGLVAWTRGRRKPRRPPRA